MTSKVERKVCLVLLATSILVRGYSIGSRFSTYAFNAVVRKSTETPDKKLAQRIYDKVRGEIATGKWFERLPGEEKLFRELMERYLSEHSARNKTPMSYRRDQSLSLHLLGSFGGLTLTEITPKLIAAYKNRRREVGAASKTVNNEADLHGARLQSGPEGMGVGH
jgi:hypothetical protein